MRIQNPHAPAYGSSTVLPPGYKSKLKVIAGLLFFFIPAIGNFYLGQLWRGLSKIVLGFLGGAMIVFRGIGLIFWIPVGIWGFIEFIFVLGGWVGYDRGEN